jgi:RNA polymerase sigma-70 factor (ECF subfamily)
MPSPDVSDPRTDEQLLPLIAAGNGQAFTALFRRRQADVYRFALHMTGVPSTAEDVTQDVFLVVMREADRYECGRSGVVAWLCGIARNCARQRLDRDRPFQPLPDAASGDERQIAAVHADPVSDLARAEGVERLRRAVLSLPIRYREVVVLCDLQELSYVQAADALGCAIGTVRSRLHRARQLLAAKMTGAHERSHSLRAGGARSFA